MKKILIIEDEAAYTHLLQRQLTAKGYAVVTADNGGTGLTVSKKEKPDVILLDIRMPVMDGLSMLEMLRKDEYGKSAKVIILSNHEPDDDILQNTLKNHPAYYLVKSDIHFSDLLQKIEEILAE